MTTNTFANRSGILGLFKPYKQQITLRIDGDVLAWAKRDGAGYQSRINAALRKAMLEDVRLTRKKA
ncbi:BrnA antitoxin family protein [Granulicella tundricola]|uniref:BrnA antitoxin family protein n=1 Tax=Granulicella tundricola TaxID=940615 RepID=UPI0003228C71|nr:BrnA antitoxin family protein [Granulicella tundricola]